MFKLKIFFLIASLLQTILSWPISLEEKRSGEGCVPPLLGVNGSELLNSSEEQRLKNSYVKVREVKFYGAIGPFGEKRLCKIKCIGNKWVGPLCVDHEDSTRFHPLFRNCRLENIGHHLVVTFRNVTINKEGWQFPHGARLNVRCRELGLYKLLGDARPTCQNGQWSSKLPSCVPTTLLTNFTEDAPPTVLIRIPAGSASVEPSGELAIYPGSTLHLECLFSRRVGNPEWTWTTPMGQYLTGWAISREEREWKYRLSIYYTKPSDSGTYTCATPRGITNSIMLHVTAVTCEKLEITDQRMTVRSSGERLGHTAIFQCPMGYKINGTANLTCQASGKWSAPMPHCELVKCPSLEERIAELEPHLHLEEHNSSWGGRAVFSCSWGYKLVGQPGIECELNGNWSGEIPKCIAIECPPPVVPAFGQLIETGAVETPEGGKYAVGSLVQFTCDGVHQVEGEGSIVCTETGFWSHPPPFCKIRCPFPGEPENGYISPTKFSYDPGDIIQVTCIPGWESKLMSNPECTTAGNWSLPLPTCTRYDQI